MKERVYTFGTHGILVGVVTEPAPGTGRPGAPAVIVSNVGLSNRCGPHRLWVELARALAQRGFTTLRFDMNGLGDSLSRRSDQDDLERAFLDLKEAVDFMAHSKGFSAFALVGICSGVDPIHRLSVEDHRIRGAVFVDGYTYPTLRYHVRRHVGRILEPRTILRGIRRRLPKAGGLRLGEMDEIYVRSYPARERMAQDLKHMLGRPMKVKFIFTGGFRHVFNHPEQFFHMLRPARFEGQVTVLMDPSADHTYRLVDARRGLVKRLGHWLSEAFPKTEG